MVFPCNSVKMFASLVVSSDVFSLHLFLFRSEGTAWRLNLLCSLLLLKNNPPPVGTHVVPCFLPEDEHRGVSPICSRNQRLWVRRSFPYSVFRENCGKQTCTTNTMDDPFCPTPQATKTMTFGWDIAQLETFHVSPWSESFVLIPRWMEYADVGFANQQLTHIWLGDACLHARIVQPTVSDSFFILFNFGTQKTLIPKSISNSIWSSCRTRRALLKITFGGRRGVKWIFRYRISSIFVWTTFSRQRLVQICERW